MGSSPVPLIAGLVAHACHPSTQVVDQKAQGVPQLHMEKLEELHAFVPDLNANTNA